MDLKLLIFSSSVVTYIIILFVWTNFRRYVAATGWIDSYLQLFSLIISYHENGSIHSLLFYLILIDYLILLCVNNRSTDRMELFKNYLI